MEPDYDQILAKRPHSEDAIFAWHQVRNNLHVMDLPLRSREPELRCLFNSEPDEKTFSIEGNMQSATFTLFFFAIRSMPCRHKCFAEWNKITQATTLNPKP